MHCGWSGWQEEGQAGRSHLHLVGKLLSFCVCAGGLPLVAWLALRLIRWCRCGFSCLVPTGMQIQHANGTGRAPTAMEVARQLVLEEGPMALFKGGMARALRVGPQLGITLMTYDWLCKHW